MSKKYAFILLALSLVLSFEKGTLNARENGETSSGENLKSAEVDSLYHSEVLRKIVRIVLEDPKNQEFIKRKLEKVHSQKAFEKWVERIKEGKNVGRKEYSYLSKEMSDQIRTHLSQIAEHPETDFEVKGNDTILVTSEKMKESIGKYGRFYDILAGKEPVSIYKLRFVIKVSPQELAKLVNEAKQVKGGFEKALEYAKQRKSLQGRVVSVYGVV